jgi:hypothetical protein
VLEKPHLRDGARKRTAEKLFRRGGLNLGRKRAQTGACWGLHVMRGKQVPPTSSNLNLNAPLSFSSPLSVQLHTIRPHTSLRRSLPLSDVSISAMQEPSTVVQQRLSDPVMQLCSAGLIRYPSRSIQHSTESQPPPRKNPAGTLIINPALYKYGMITTLPYATSSLGKCQCHHCTNFVQVIPVFLSPYSVSPP